MVGFGKSLTVIVPNFSRETSTIVHKWHTFSLVWKYVLWVSLPFFHLVVCCWNQFHKRGAATQKAPLSVIGGLNTEQGWEDWSFRMALSVKIYAPLVNINPSTNQIRWEEFEVDFPSLISTY